MQTKNVNLDNSQQQGAGSLATHDKSLRQADDRSQPQQQPRGAAGGDQAPPLPPRGPPLTPVHARLLQAAQVDGQGPYKPVPPPKPLAGGHSPPPYRMPPYPLYGETAIPGAAATVGANPASTLHTHSSKFPIEREVILSSADKNSKIPILHEYKKRPKSTLTAIAPDGPAKQIAWTEDRRAVEGANGAEDPVVLTRIQHGLYGDLRHTSMGMEELSHHVYKAHPLQLHDGSRISKQQLNQGMSSDYRVQYRSANTIADSSPYLYNGGVGGASTGAVPRTWTVGARGEDTRSPQPPPVTSRPPPLLPHGPRRDHSAERRVDDKNTGDEERSNAQNAEMIAESSGKDGAAKDTEKNKAFSSRTLHTIKDMISSRFGGTKGVKESGGECVGEEDKPVESTLGASMSLNNNQTGGGGDKGQVGSPRKAVGNCAQQEDGQVEERDQNHRQHVLGGGPQVIGPSRNYGDIHHGMGVGTGYQGRRGAVEGAENLDRARVAEAEDALRRSGRGRGGPLDHGVYATARNAQQAHYSRSVGDFSRELASQGQEPVYGCHAGSRQHPAGAKVLGGSRVANFGSQPGLLDQNGIYMVMRQPGSASQQVYGHQGAAHYHQETEQHHDVRRCVVDNRVGPGQDRVAVRAQGDESNPTRDPGRRGSQTHLDDEDDDDGGFLMEAGKSRKNPGEGAGQGGQHQSSGQSSDYEKATQRSTGQSSSNADSGRGSTIYSSGHKMVGAKRGEVCERLDTSTESSESPQALERRDNMYGNDSEWVDIVESELRQILDPKLHGLGHQPPPPAGANSTLSESISSLTPPLPPLSPGGGSSPAMSPRSSGRYKLSASLPYGSKLEYCEGPKHGDSRKGGQGSAVNKTHRSAGGNTPGSRGGWGGRSGGKNQLPPDKSHRGLMGGKKMDHLLSAGKSGKMPLSASVFGLDTTDLTSTTTGLDSMLDGNTENNSSDDDLSTTIDATDAHAIRKQLEGLENMYSEVLKLLGVKKYGGRYQPSDPRINKRRLYGSMSSLPSSVSSRPVRDKRRQDDRKKVKDMKGINKRFQRLESHVVTLARSVAHLSSEMRTQHLMIQEMENIRGEISALRAQTLAVRSHSMPRGLNALLPGERGDAALTNPQRVKKLTKFFGDEPPLLRLFLKKLGYEKYANAFENERVGMVELPYMTEERLQKMGIPLGPRLRILQEAQVSLCRDKVYVV